MRHRKRHSVKKHKKLYHFRAFWIVFLLTLLGGAVGYFLFFSPTFQVEANAQYFIPHKSIFLIDGHATEQAILKAYPAIETVVVEKRYPATITVTAKERQAFSVFCDSPANCFFIDKNGIIFEKVDAPVGLIISTDPAKLEIFPGEKVVEKNTIEAIVKIQTSLKQNFNVDVSEALVSNPLIITTGEKWKVYFDLAADIDLQITKMNMLLKNDISAATRTSLQYIYLQYKDRAYYK